MAQGAHMGRSDTAAIWGAAAAGLAAGLAVNVGRKLMVQAASGVTGDWVDALATEHRMALAIFDKLEQTRDDQKMKRSTLLTQLKHALGKHAFEEENVVYPALRQHGDSEHADKLNHDHGYVKQYLYELENMAKDDPQWLSKVGEFRQMIEEHMREEENEVFPAFRAQLSDTENKKLTLMMNKEGFKVA